MSCVCRSCCFSKATHASNTGKNCTIEYKQVCKRIKGSFEALSVDLVQSLLGLDPCGYSWTHVLNGESVFAVS